MATVNPTVSNLIGQQDGSMLLYTWIITTADNDGLPLEKPEWADITWVIGRNSDTFGGATCAVQGANINSHTNDFVTLNDAAGGGAATATAIKAITIIQNPLFVRPALTVVGAGATITVTALLRRATGMRQ